MMSNDDEVVHEALCNELVLDNLFKYLSLADLLRSSLVCKLWRSSCRRAIRKTGRCLIHLPHKPDCKNLQALTSILRDSHDMPYVGMSISCETSMTPIRRGENDDKSKSSWKELHKVLWRKMPELKFLRLDLGSCRSTVSEEGIQTLLYQFDNQLEGLSLRWNWSAEAWLELPEMPKLVELEVPNCIKLVGDMDMMRWNLKRLTGKIDPVWLILSRQLRENIPILKELYVYFTPNEEEHQRRLQFVEQGPKLEKLTFSSVRYPLERIRGAMPVEYTNRCIIFLKSLLDSSKGSLEYLEIELLDLISQLPEQLPVFGRLKSLKIICDETTDHNELNYYMGKINFSHHFPCITKLEFKFHETKSLNKQHYISEELGRMPICFSASPVEVLILTPPDKNYVIPVASVQVLAQMFPQIKNLELKHCIGRTIFPVIFSGWPYLERIVLSDTLLRDLDGNVDDVFCGIAPADVLRLRYGTNLRHVRLNSPAPSILNLQRLRSITIEVNHRAEIHDPVDNPGRLWLSEVTGACALAHMPNLTLRVLRTHVENMSTEKCFNLDHLSPFVTVETRDSGIVLMYK